MSLRFLTAGESHGPALIGVIEGLPSGLSLTREHIQAELARRKKGHGRGDRQKIEADGVEILSGVRFGKTLGSPISLQIKNQDWQNWSEIMKIEPGSSDEKLLEVPRPGHADYVGGVKYRHHDMRNVLERASARETTMRVALGAVAKSFLSELGVVIYSRVTEIGGILDTNTTLEWWTESNLKTLESSRVRVLNLEQENLICDYITRAQEEGETLGGQFEVVALGVPLGLGSYSQWDRRIEGDLAKQFLSLNAIKSFEIGLGAVASKQKGSDAHDEMSLGKNSSVQYSTNRSGGVTGGMTTGQPLLVRAGMKPLSTLKKTLSSVSVKTKEATKSHYERSDVCAVPSAAVIGESLMAFVLSQHILEKFGGDSMAEVKERVVRWKTAEEFFWKS